MVQESLIKRLLVLLFTLAILCSTHSVVLSSDDDWDKPSTLLKPYKQNAYGPGVNSDATGRPFKWQTQDGKDVAPNTKVKPDAYGPDVGMDEYGRPVKARRW
jgi:hypothetical protein